MCLHAAVERLRKGGQFPPQLAAGQLGQDQGVVLPSAYRAQHEPPAHPQDIAGYVRQLERGRF
jgi:hypothetical protein